VTPDECIHLCEDVIDEGVVGLTDEVQEVGDAEPVAHQIAVAERRAGLLLRHPEILEMDRVMRLDELDDAALLQRLELDQS
jgi:hypothetical protein